MRSSGKSSNNGSPGSLSRWLQEKSLSLAINTQLNSGKIKGAIQGNQDNQELSPIRQMLLEKIKPLMTGMDSTIPGISQGINIVLSQVSDRDAINFLLTAEKMIADALDEIEPLVRAAADAENNGLATNQNGTE